VRVITPGSNSADPVPIPAGIHPGMTEIWFRGRANFDAVIYELQNTHGMAKPSEVILSGGSAGGLAVFYNLDHLATLLPATTRLTGFPDAGFFMDHAEMSSPAHTYTELFKGSDPVWNVTGGGGTNLACLADLAPKGEGWKCLMAQYASAYIETPLYVMNSAVDAWQMGNIFKLSCKPEACEGADLAKMQAYSTTMQAAVAASVTTGKPKNGAFLDNCYVHEQNVNYCSSQVRKTPSWSRSWANFNPL
jgi:hypothetical protein